MHFTDQNHPDYNDLERKWSYAWKNYTGEYADDREIGNFLHRKEQRETQRAYEERKKLADPIMLFPTAVDSINGIVSSKNEEVKRDWGELGDPEEPNSTAYRLNRNADGEGMDWTPLMKQAGIRLTVMHKVWGLVDGVITEDEKTVREASVSVINPQSVVDWYPSTGPLRQVLVKESQDQRISIKDTESDSDSDIYILYELEGWTRFRIEEYEDKNGEMQTRDIILGSDTYEYYATTAKDQRILPIFYTEIPMPRPVGYLLAKKQNHIFNQESRRDFSLGNMSFALGVLTYTEKDMYDDAMNSIEKGWNWIFEEAEATGGHRFISPESDFLSAFDGVLEKKRKDFYESAFKEYGDAAQVTATQVRLESRSGIEAFLYLLVTSLDEFENDCLWRLTQVYHSNTSAWGTASVERPKQFQIEDVNEAYNKMTSGVLNADRAGAISTFQKVKDLRPDWTVEQIEEEVKRIREERGALPAEMQGA